MKYCTLISDHLLAVGVVNNNGTFTGIQICNLEASTTFSRLHYILGGGLQASPSTMIILLYSYVSKRPNSSTSFSKRIAALLL